MAPRSKARVKRSTVLSSQDQRLRLEVGKDHVEHLSPGCFLHYRRPLAGGNGTWRARWRPSHGAPYQSKALGAAADHIAADGTRIRSYEQASTAAAVWFRERGRAAHLVATGEVLTDRPPTVADAIALLLAEAEKAGQYVPTLESYSRTRILPELGEYEVPGLTRLRLEKWRDDLAASPRMVTGQKYSAAGDWAEDPTEDQLRARKSTANRILAIVKRALNLLVLKGRYSGPTPWRDVMPFSKVKGQRLRVLDPKETRALVAGCAPDFANVVRAALYTGSRWAPLTRLEVRDFHPSLRAVFIHQDKGGRSRYVYLSDEGLAWFKRICKGKAPGDLMFTRISVQRRTRQGRPGAWEDDDQGDFMDAACEASGVDRLTFHELRHTYASGLLNAGFSLVYLAKQLGHANTRMVEEHYGHIAEASLAASVRERSPKLGIGGKGIR